MPLSYQPKDFMEAAKSASVINGPDGPLLMIGGSAFKIVSPVDENAIDITRLFAEALRKASAEPSPSGDAKA